MKHDLRSKVEKLVMVEAAYGRAMLRAHGVEQMLTTWLICVASSTTNKAASRADIARIKRLTLGGVVKRFVHEALPPASLAEELSTLLTLRNDLTHRISELFAEAARTVNWEDHAIAELLAASDRLAQCRSELQPYMASARAMAGISEQEIKETIRSQFPGMRIGI